MPVKQFEAALYGKLKAFFDKYGFVLMADKKQFRKITATGFQNVIFTATVYEDETWLEVNFGGRNNQIEQIAQQFLGNTRDFWSDSNTLVVSIGKFNDAKYFQYKIITEPDLEDVCEIIKDFLVNTGFPFMNDADNLVAISNVLNAQPTQRCNYLYNQTHRVFKAVIAAKLTHHKNFLALTDIHRNTLTKIGATAEELMTYERMLSFLLYHSVN